MMCSSSFYPKITLPTRISEHSATIIDNFFFKFTPLSLSSDSCILISDMSDHLPCYIGFNISVKCKNKSYPCNKPKNATVNISKLKNHLSCINFKDILNTDPLFDPDINYNIFANVLFNAIKENIYSKFNKI